MNMIKDKITSTTSIYPIRLSVYFAIFIPRFLQDGDLLPLSHWAAARVILCIIGNPFRKERSQKSRIVKTDFQRYTGRKHPYRRLVKQCGCKL
ncbi:hypothetical protein EVA_04686 [gut metagenome]|uniref:Uncharacterized protein n=1 Tax=gut metagenome TaxID=749906 RepID=J9D3H7_9ZZZZ